MIVAWQGGKVTVSAAEGERAFFLTWTGRAWVRDRTEAIRSRVMRCLADDGRSGTYALATLLWPASDSHPDVKDLFHRTAKGRWTRLPLPARLSGVKTIAFLNTRLLAVGHAETGYATTAVSGPAAGPDHPSAFRHRSPDLTFQHGRRPEGVLSRNEWGDCGRVSLVL